MGPLILFDKSFLQSLTEDESVWFGHFFSPIVCPIFYIETLADLDKDLGKKRTPESEVRIISRKFPEASAYPCSYHADLAFSELLGNPVPINGSIPRFGGRAVKKDGQSGVIYEPSREEKAFSRWMDEEFSDLERKFACEWRVGLEKDRLDEYVEPFRKIGVDAKSCKSLSDARSLAESVITGRENHFTRMQLAVEMLDIPRQFHRQIIEIWSANRYPPIAEYAPFVAHVVSVELFFNFAMAAHQIGTERSSNRVDMAYLNYLPFCQIFISNDKLHRRCAPHFLGDNQEFVWGPDLKADLRRINEYFEKLPDEVKDQSIMSFAGQAPDLDESITRRLRAKFLRTGIDDEKPVSVPPKSDVRSKELINAITSWEDAEPGELSPGEPEFMSIQRKVRRKKGNWYQIPKNLKD